MDRRTGDDGFTLVEIIVAIAVIGVLMAALTAFFVTTVSTTRLQGERQVAARLAVDGTERARALAGPALTTGRDRTSSDTQWASPVAGVAAWLADMREAWDATAAYPSGTSAPLPTTARSATVDGLRYGQNWYVGNCWQPPAGGACTTVQAGGYVPFFRVVVAVTWTDHGCTNATCSFVTSTIVNSTAVDPVFAATSGAPPPTATRPANQNGRVAVPVRLQVNGSGGAPPLIWSATGLPAGLAMDSSGLVTGTPTTAGTSTVTVTVTDALGRAGSAAFTWTVR